MCGVKKVNNLKESQNKKLKVKVLTVNFRRMSLHAKDIILCAREKLVNRYI